MCTFMSTLARKSKTAGTDSSKKRNLVLFLKPCPNDANGKPTWYRFRLLNFLGANNNGRDYPFIPRYVHQKWGQNAKGFTVVEDEVVCPVTKWTEWDGDRYDDCPICRFAGQQFGALKESNWKDADARKKNREFSRKFQGIVPVYVVKDPNYDGNNGKFRVIVFSDKAQYDDFVKKVEVQLMKANCFNGENAVDCLFHVSIVDKVRDEGQPNEYRWKQKEIDNIAFMKADKAYTIPAITKQAIDAFPFDEEFYKQASLEDLKEFYSKHIDVQLSDDDIDTDDVVIPAVSSKPQEKIAKTNIPVKSDELFANMTDTVNTELEDANDLVEDPDNDGLVVKEEEDKTDSPAEKTADAFDPNDVDVDSLLNGIDV